MVIRQIGSVDYHWWDNASNTDYFEAGGSWWLNFSYGEIGIFIDNINYLLPGDYAFGSHVPRTITHVCVGKINDEVYIRAEF